jgi:hypothetical protein
MTSPLHDRIEQAMAELERQKKALSGFAAQATGRETEVTSHNRLVRATVDSRGDLVALKFLSTTYRSMAGAEFGHLIVDTVREARGKAKDEALDLFASLVPGGATVVDRLRRPIDLESALGEVMESFGGTPARDEGQR